MGGGDGNSADFDKAIGQRLRRVRKEQGLSLVEVEQLSRGEFKHSALGAYERGARTLSVPRLERLAALYQVPVERLLPSAGAAPSEAAVVKPQTQPAPQAVSRPDSAGWRRLHIDLAALEDSGSDLAPLRRYVQSICRQRGAAGADRITLRGEDLQPVASLCGMEALDAVLWLHSRGVLSRPSTADLSSGRDVASL